MDNELQGKIEALKALNEKRIPGPYLEFSGNIYSQEAAAMVCQVSEPHASTSIRHQEVDIGSKDFTLAMDTGRYILSACNLAPALVERIRELEKSPDWVDELAKVRSDNARLTALVDTLRTDSERVSAENAALKDDYQNACYLVAKMHEAAMGEIRGPIRGPVEDIEDLRADKNILDTENNALKMRINDLGGQNAEQLNRECERLASELADEKTGRHLLAQATDRINDLEADNPEQERIPNNLDESASKQAVKIGNLEAENARLARALTDCQAEFGEKVAEIQALKAQVEQERWIPVGERLPPVDDGHNVSDQVQVYNGDDIISPCVYVFRELWELGYNYPVGWWSGSQRLSKPVTHWRPLSAPPQDGER